MKVILADAGIGDEEALRAEAEPDALGDAGEHGGERRADGAVENPDRLETIAPQQRDKPEQIEAAAQLRAAVLEIEDLGNARFGGKQVLGAACRRRQKAHAAARARLRRWRG